jgi:tetratricopeptide (TPR) repeat protein
VAGTDPGTMLHAGSCNNLGEALLARFERTGQVADLEHAVEVFERAVELVGESRVDGGRFRSGLAGALGARYLLNGQRADLDRAIDLLTVAVAASPSDPPAPPSAANRRHSLGLLLERRYAATGDSADLDAAVRLFEEAVHLTDPASPAMPRMQASLGNALRAGFARHGDRRLLDDAIDRYTSALHGLDPQVPARATYLDNLAMALLDRHESTGSIDDLDEAIRLLHASLAATPADAQARAGVLNNLGNALWTRHAHRPDGSDLDEALAAFARAVELTPSASPDAPIYLDNYANALGDRFRWTGTFADLNAAVAAYERALGGLPRDAPDFLRVRTNLAASLLSRYREGSPRNAYREDLDRAVEILEGAVAATPPASPALVLRLNNLGVALKYRHERDHDAVDLERGRRALAEACGPLRANDVRWSLAACLTLAGWARDRGEWHDAAAGYRVAMTVAEEYLRVQLLRQSTEAALRSVHEMYADAAHVFLRVGERLEAATAVERGRAVLASQALQRERAVIELAGHAGTSTAADLPGLADRLRRALNTLGTASRFSDRGLELTPLPCERATGERRVSRPPHGTDPPPPDGATPGEPGRAG